MLAFEDDATRVNGRPVGLPRPLADHDGKLRPTPWSQDDPIYPDDPTPWAVLDPAAAARATAQSLCLVCGEHVAEGSVIARIQDIPTAGRGCRPRLIRRKALRRVYIIDGGPLHERCLLITRAHCMHIRNGLKDGTHKTIAYRD